MKRRWLHRKQSVDSINADQTSQQTSPLSNKLVENEKALRAVFTNCSDVVFRTLKVRGEDLALLVYVDGLCNVATLDEAVLKPILYQGIPQGLGRLHHLGQILKDELVSISNIAPAHSLGDVVTGVVQARIAILVNGESSALLAELKLWESRSVEEPSAEVAIRGPREGFTETIRVNTSLLRRKVRSANLKMELMTIGDVSHTDVVVTYIDGIVNESILQEVRTRLKRIKIDGLLDSGYIEEFIEDSPFSPFPQIQDTERPDVVIAGLLEGKVAIMVDGSPSVLLAPFTFWSGFEASEDYYERFLYATFIRWLRFLLLNMALFLPSLYVAVTTFHPQLIPANLLLSFAAAREQSPFPAVVEALLMEFIFEGLREAGIRLPKAVGSAVSIVGALVIGQAAVQAGLISAPMVIVVATTGIASFAVPRYSFGIAYRLLRFPMLLLAGSLGFFGIVAGSLAILIHQVNLRSFGVPYLSPLGPQIVRNLQNVLLRPPLWSMNKRPALIANEESTRIPKGQKPGPKR